MRMNRLVVSCASLLASAALAGPLTPVPDANPKIPGVSAPNVLSPELVETPVAQGSNRLENPSAEVSFYGYDNDAPSFIPLPGAVQTPGTRVEASKTEPDKNTYLVLGGQRGADPSYDYGRHFLFQGHETGTIGYITRVNLDADDAHRVTRMAQTDTTGANLPAFDGSTWNPFARRLLFTSENGANGGVWQATLDFPSTVEPLHGSMGRGGYEGIQTDPDGNVWIVEDVGGASSKSGRRPNSFIYRFVPKHRHDLTRGRLQVLQVISLRTGTPIVFDPGVSTDAAILSDEVKDLHSYGKVFRTRWVTIHDTAVSTASFDANALAKSFGGTPFKRPENGQFRPGSDFREFFFDETGDTNLNTQAGTTFGGFGALFRLRQSSPSADEGTLQLFYNGDAVHAGFDNVAFWDRNHVVFVEDAGDTLHSQRNALDSAWLFDVRVDYSNPANQPIRILAQGRDTSATIDSAYGAIPNSGFQNEGDNEITGIHVSDGDPSARGLLGAKIPEPFDDGWRVFYTQQHGDNVTWEILPASGRRLDRHDRDDRRDDDR